MDRKIPINIIFLDTEIGVENGRIIDIGALKPDGSNFHSDNFGNFKKFIYGSEFLCGHNIIEHDLKYLSGRIDFSGYIPIDTLFWSPLLFPAKPYHALLKDDKLQSEEINNPLNDAGKAKNLFYDELSAFKLLDNELKQIFYTLLNENKLFSGFFKAADYKPDTIIKTEDLIFKKFNKSICRNAELKNIINSYPTELAYSLALVNINDRYSITPPWVLKRFPDVQRIMYLLRKNPCIEGCDYCSRNHNIHIGLKKFFGFDSFRTYVKVPLQEMAVKAAVNNKSILAIFPTGGGKSLTFQLPALMQGENVNGLTIVISPLQSLMKDQVDNLEKAGITDAVTINGLLDPIERAKSIERVENGSASLLYISPESLRSRTIENLLLGRNIVRFVIDEAHCFSAWGQDFRVDYLYIGDFIKQLKEKKRIEEDIPVSCFTATAKQNVIQDIKNYFHSKLNLELEVFKTDTARENLTFKVYPKKNEEEKYNSLRDLLESHDCPAIIYVSRTQKTKQLSERLNQDGYNAKPYHGKMDKQEKTKNQDNFINGNVRIMVATSAFGMGVDKKDVGLVVHYEISDSLENYIQEAGRAGRDENINASCYVLYNEEDLNKHFILLNQTKLHKKEIEQVWKAIKELTVYRSRISRSALEIARKAGWETSITDVETRVKTAIAALEESGYLKRGQNIPRVFADSILVKNAEEAINKIYNSNLFNKKQEQNAVRIIKKLISAKYRKQAAGDEPETRVDYISDHLGIPKEEVIEIIYLFREEKILSDAKDLSAFLKKNGQKQSAKILKTYLDTEDFLFSVIDREKQNLNLKMLNEQLEENGINGSSVKIILTILNFWSVKNWIKQEKLYNKKNHIGVLFTQEKNILMRKFLKRKELAVFTVEYLYGKIDKVPDKDKIEKENILIEFSVNELKAAYKNSGLFAENLKLTINDIEDTLFYMSRIDALKLEGGFLVIYNKLTIERLEKDNKIRYKQEDYSNLNNFYENKIQQIHIVGKYAEKMISDYKDALQFVDDYFQLNYNSFLHKYFKGSKGEYIKRNITPGKFRQLFGELSPSQLKIINDRDSKYIVAAAGPGSGKTRILVHKLASLLLMEDVKHEQLLMLTFSRAAAAEFKHRLIKLIGGAAAFVDIKTFHSYCFDLLGKVGNLEKTDRIINEAIEKILNRDVEPSMITKTVLVIDESQDMDASEYRLVSVLMDINEEMRVIAAGDDDQSIFGFRGASPEYLERFIIEKRAVKYELLENYRSRANLVDFSNKFVSAIRSRLKKNPVVPVRTEKGNITIVKYSYGYIIPVLTDRIIDTDLTGTTGILTQTNDQALQITGTLIYKGYPAKLIQTNNSFGLFNLYEIKFFIYRLDLKDDTYVINDEIWQETKKELLRRFSRSSKLDLCLNILNNFELANPQKKYRSDFEVFLRESKLEDFVSGNLDTIIVSTIHKSKGREFDNVYILLNNFKLDSDDKKRELYVAMTRAKNNLTIFLNNSILDNLLSENISVVRTEGSPAQNATVLQLTHRDIWLGFFDNPKRQELIKYLQSGDKLRVAGSTCYTEENIEIIKFSKAFTSRLEGLIASGYRIEYADINFILFWENEDSGREIKIILPELYLEKTAG